MHLRQLNLIQRLHQEVNFSVHEQSLFLNTISTYVALYEIRVKVTNLDNIYLDVGRCVVKYGIDYHALHCHFLIQSILIYHSYRHRSSIISTAMLN